MKNKMNLDVNAETIEEKEIENFLNMLHNNKEIKKFLSLMQEEATKRDVEKFRARIKNVDSAIRTYRINNKKLEDVRDYVGVSFITKTEKEIYPIINYLNKILPNADFVDFVAEESLYSPLVYIKWVPPLGYNVLAKEPIIADQPKVPIEIRVCSREGYISEQSAYYSVQKNDTIQMPVEQKNNLRNKIQHISYKFALLNMRDLTSEERIKHMSEINALLNDNKQLLKENSSIFKDSVSDFGRLVYRYEHDTEMTEDEKNLSKENIDKLDEKLKEIFETTLEEIEENIIDKVCNAIEKMRLMSYYDIKKLLS